MSAHYFCASVRLPYLFQLYSNEDEVIHVRTSFLLQLVDCDLDVSLNAELVEERAQMTG